MFNLVNLDEVREEMISEIQSDIDAGRLYIDDRLSARGKQIYPARLLESARTSDVAGFIRSLGMTYFNSWEWANRPKGGKIQKNIPSNANENLCSTQFNRFYIRAVCLKAISLGQEYVTAYRARPSSNPRPESNDMLGRTFPTDRLLAFRREHVDDFDNSDMPGAPNSGMSVRL